MDVTKYITACALEKKIIVVDGLQEMISVMKAIGRNLNQLTTLANMNRLYAPDLSEVRELFSKIYGRLFEISGRKF